MADELIVRILLDFETRARAESIMWQESHAI